MLGHPKYKKGDIVRFKTISYDDVLRERQPQDTICIGEIYIVDAHGTSEQNYEVSYDIMIPGVVLMKHCVESSIVELIRSVDGEREDDFVKFDKDTNIMLVAAVCLLLAFDAKEGQRDLNLVRKMLNLNSTMISRDGLIKPGLEWLFYDYKERQGSINLVICAFKAYKKTKDL